MELDLRRLLQIARRRWWIVVLAALIGATVGYTYAARQPEMYSARAQILMLSMPDTGSRYTGLLASQNLKPSYMLIIESEPVMQQVIDDLKLPLSVSALQGKVSVADIPDTQFLNVYVTDTNPTRAASIATSVVQNFVDYIKSQGNEGLGVPVDVANTAKVPSAPFEPRPRYTAMIGLLAGTLIGLMIVALLEYFYSAVTPEHDLEELIDAPVLATVTQISNLKAGSSQVYSMTQPQSSAAEAIRLLRTNIGFASASADIGKLVITSPGPGEGKSTVIANLGVVMAQSGSTVVIVDADLRKPTLHRIFGVPGDRGLTTLLTRPEEPWQKHAEKVALPGLYLIPSGPIPPNPADLAGSPRLAQLLDRLADEVDIVLIDSPPLLSATDSLSMASKADGMLLVAQSHRTRIEAINQAARAARRGDIRLVGVVLNRLKGQRGAHYYGKYYASKTVPGD